MDKNEALGSISYGFKQKNLNHDDSGKGRDEWLSIELFDGGFEEVGEVF